MTRKEMKLKIKEERKSLAGEIRKLKSARKGAMYGHVSGLAWASEEYREKHVAYCTFFNHTSYELIESNPREPLSYNSYSRFINDWEKEITDVKVVHTSA